MLNIYVINLHQLPLQSYMLTWKTVFDRIKTAAPAEVLIFLQKIHQAEVSTMRQNKRIHVNIN